MLVPSSHLSNLQVFWHTLVSSLLSLSILFILELFFIILCYERITIRKSVNSIGFFGSAIFLFLMSMQDTPFGLIICLSLVNICTGVCVGGFNVNQADIGPKYTGSMFGISGAIGISAAIISPIITGIILDETSSYLTLYYLNCFLLIFGGLFYLIFASAEKQFD